MTQDTSRSEIDRALKTAVQHHQAGRLADAETIYRHVLAQQPNRADALNLLGVLACQQGRSETGAELIEKSIAIQPGIAEYHNNFANALKGAGRPDEAITQYEQALELDPDNAQVHFNLGNILSQKGRTEEAVPHFKNAIRLQPNLATAHYQLGMALANNHPDEAITEFQTAIRLKLQRPELHHRLALLLKDKLQLEEAAAELSAAIALRPDYPEAHNDLGNILRNLGRPAEAEASYQTALRLKSDLPDAPTNLGMLLRDQKRFDEAVAAFEAVIASQPDNAEAHVNLGMTFLLRGEFDKGWPEYEWRLRSARMSRPQQYPQPLWNGERLRGKPILLHPEQGLGDTIQFIRYAPMVANRGGKVILLCQPALARLLVGFPGVEKIITPDDPLPDFAIHCPLLSLPAVFATQFETIPAETPYLLPDADRVDAWAKKLGPLSAGASMRVGLSWAGNPNHPDDRARSIPLSQFHPLAALKNIEFHSLQKTSPPSQDDLHLIDHAAELNDLTDAAALLANLDLVITVDTAIAHLAGAMGKQFWLLLPFVPDWRWLLDRSDSPWYPTAHLFRQTRPGDWSPLIQSITQRLAPQ